VETFLASWRTLARLTAAIQRQTLFASGHNPGTIPNYATPDVLDGGDGTIDLHYVLPQNALTAVASSSRRPEFCMLFTFCPLGAQ
jgi:hypothetical protein